MSFAKSADAGETTNVGKKRRRPEEDAALAPPANRGKTEHTNDAGVGSDVTWAAAIDGLLVSSPPKYPAAITGTPGAVAKASTMTKKLFPLLPSLKVRGPGQRGGLTEDSIWAAIHKVIKDEPDDAAASITDLLEKLTTRIREDHSEDAFAVADWAAKNDHLDIIKILLASGIANEEGQTLLHYAVESEHLYMVDALIAAGAEVDIMDESDRTPLHYGAGSGYLDIVIALVTAGANPALVDSKGCTPIEYAEINQYADVLEVLLNLYQIAFDAACTNNHETVRKILLNISEIPDQFQEGWTLLHYAAENNLCDIGERLLELEANIQARDSDGWTPLHCAVHIRDTRMTELLLAAGADVNAIDEFGQTPLHYAVKANHVDTVKALLAAGANANTVDEDGLTPINYAMGEEIKSLLKEKRSLLQPDTTTTAAAPFKETLTGTEANLPSTNNSPGE